MKYFYSKKRIVVIIFLTSIYNVLSVVFAFCLMSVTDAVIRAEMSVFLRYSLFSVACLGLQIILYITQTKYKNNYIAHCMTCLKRDLISGICEFSYPFFSKSSIETYQSFFINDLKLFENQYYRQILEMMSNVSLLVAAIIGVCLIDAVFLLIIILIVAIAMMLPIVFKRRIMEANRQYTGAAKELLSSLNEMLQGFSVIKNFNVFNIFIKKVTGKAENAEYSYANFENRITMVNAFMAFAGQILILVAFAIGGYFSVIGRITTGSIVALSQLLTHTLEPINSIAGTATSIKAIEPVKENCDQILNYQVVQIPKKLYAIPHKLFLKGLSFKYEESVVLFENVDLTFEYPLKYAIIGKNGCGKSTLLSIIAGLQDGYSGDVFIDDCDVKSMSEKEYNSYISFLSQTPFVFSMLTDENINMFQTNASKEKIKEVLITSFQIGHLRNSIIDSSSISGGEKSKIATIRALLKESPFLLMDEPTAAMDEDSRTIFDSLISSIKDKLCIIVTHRIDESLKKYDKFVIIENNHVILTDDYCEVIRKMSGEDC